ncbi:carbon-nitrogen hydrolase family protein [Halomontanus rarus]|uniref:carbon-nitrogen hydrolase family protein n=1 Tax=Halomontanus rarus TaxID=3034020 RepID=UPI001A99C506|nr:carbon-nitrogen hydrolase family protein [Halovivax sp. TS33]
MREARVLLIAQNDPVEVEDEDRIETNLSNSLALLDEAKAYDPDFVCFPEFILQLRFDHDGLAREDVAQPIPGPATDAVGEKAAELESYVLFPMIERDGDDLYNAIAFVGPDGEVIGTSHKLVPTIGEMEDGTKPGEDVVVWETEFGRVGSLICWDSRYPELGVRLAQKGADLVFFPTTGSAHLPFRTWASYYGYHVAYCDKNDAKVFTPTGDVIAHNDDGFANPSIDLGDGGEAHLSFSIVNTDVGVYGDSQTMGAMSDILDEYAGSLVFHEANREGTVVLESVDDSVTLADVENEFGVEPMFDLEERTRRHVLDIADRTPLLPHDD